MTATGLAGSFQRGLRLRPDGAALVLADRRYSYADLDATARRIAAALGGLHPSRRRRVGVLATRSLECYAGILGALYAGATVVPLSPAFPTSRTAAMLRAAGVTTLVVDRLGASCLTGCLEALTATPGGATGLTAVFLEPPRHRPRDVRVIVASAAPTGDRAPAPDLDAPAYILFTSGSTGRPKGVPVSHRNMAHFLAVAADRYQLAPDDVLSQTFDTTFDLAMFDLFVGWAAGATVVSTPPAAFRALPDFARRHGLTVWFSVPSAISVVRRHGGLAPGALGGLRHALFCGEQLLTRDADDWHRAAPGAVLENLYGPTELTIACTAHRWQPGSAGQYTVPIGRPFPGLRHLVLDERGRPGAPRGELCVSGPQMVAGYLDPADDTGRFLTRDGRRWYRTGDLVQVDGDVLTHLGRVDQQTKIRGYRVELPEIEEHARALSGVDDAAAVPVSTPSSARIGLWYAGATELDGRLRRHLAARLPEYMVPHFVWRLDELPRNHNGKLDRPALTERAAERVGTA